MRQFNKRASRLIDLCILREEAGRRAYRLLRRMLEAIFVF